MRYTYRQPYPNELMGIDPNSRYLAHWKYLKKYRGSNGDWVYVYDEAKNKLTGLKNNAQKKYDTFSAKSNANYQKRWDDDLARVNQKNLSPEEKKREIDNVNRWYSDRKLKSHIEDYHKEHYSLPGMDKDPHHGGYREEYQEYEKAQREADKHEKSIKGKIDSFMEKNGDKVASVVNATIGKAQNVANLISSKSKETASSIFSKIKDAFDAAKSKIDIETEAVGLIITRKKNEEHYQNIAARMKEVALREMKLAEDEMKSEERILGKYNNFYARTSHYDYPQTQQIKTKSYEDAKRRYYSAKRLLNIATNYKTTPSYIKDMEVWASQNKGRMK